MFRPSLSTCVALVAFLLAVLWQSTVSDDKLVEVHEEVLLVTAHPDDECMFFAPTILSLIAQNVSVHSLCLSVGNMDGLGTVRTKELAASLDVFGVPQMNRRIIDHPSLQDDIKSPWNHDLIADIVGEYVTQHKITTILTFDAIGVSGHPNHASLPAGLKLLSSGPSPPKLFTLVSVPLLSKYLTIIAPLQAKFDLFVSRFVHVVERKFFGVQSSSVERPTLPVFVSGFQGYSGAILAMQKHQSQLVWFRYLYLLFSRYLWVNEWVQVRSS